jgi:hypothetical protein
MVTGLQILSSGFWGSILEPKFRQKIMGNPNILGMAQGYQILLLRANLSTSKFNRILAEKV